MKKLIISCFVLGFLILCIPPSRASYERPPTKDELITKYATDYKIDEHLFRKVIKCESNGNPQAINFNDGGKGKHSIGILQYQKTTFDRYAIEFGEKLDYNSYNDQLKLGAWMLSQGEGHNWTCWRKINGIK